MRAPKKRAIWLALPLLAALTACFDFGYSVDLNDEAADGGMSDGEAAADGLVGECVERAVAPTEEGRQIRLITLDVDTRVIQISPGDTITWTNTDTEVHTVTAGAPNAEIGEVDGGFDSGDLPPGAQWAYRFCSPRQIFYFCRTHPDLMNGYLITVAE